MNFNSTLFLTIERQPLSCLLFMLQIEEMKSWKQMKVVLTDFFYCEDRKYSVFKKKSDCLLATLLYLSCPA